MKLSLVFFFVLVFSLPALCQTGSLQEGNKCFDSGDYTCAITKYEQALKSVTGRDKQLAEIYLGRARTCSDWLKKANQYFNQGNYKLAKDNYQNVLNENPNDPFASGQIEKCEKALVTISVSRKDLSFPSSGGNEIVIITTEADSYSIYSIPSWYTVRKDEKSIYISCSANLDSKARNGAIAISVGEKSQTITVSQKGKELEISLTTSRQNLVIPAQPTIREIIDVKTNGKDYYISGLPSWCSLSKKEPTWFSLAFGANNTSQSRKASIKVISGNKEVVITLYQQAKSNTNTYTGTPKSTSTASSAKKSSPGKKKCFNCPQTKDPWGLTLGYSNLIYDPLTQSPLPNNSLRNGFQFGLRFDPLFKGGFGLNTGIFLDAYSNTVSSNKSSNFEIDRIAFSIPLHLEYRLNFSKWFNMFAFGGPRISTFSQPGDGQNALPATLDYGAGIRINRIQFNAGKSLYIGNFRDFSNIGKETSSYQDIEVSISYMF